MEEQSTNDSRIPLAIREVLHKFYGGGAAPDFGGVVDVYRRDPYSIVLTELSETWDLVEHTNVNYDVSQSIVLSRAGEAVYQVMLSYVGPYAVVLDVGAGYRVCDDELVWDVLKRHGFAFVTEELIEERTGLVERYLGRPLYGNPAADFSDVEQSEPHDPLLYEMLFHHGEGLPWDDPYQE